MLPSFMALSAWFAARGAAQSGAFCGVTQQTCEPGTLAGVPTSCETYCECDTDSSGQATTDCGGCWTTTLGGETMAAASTDPLRAASHALDAQGGRYGGSVTWNRDSAWLRAIQQFSRPVPPSALEIVCLPKASI
mgnify:CR=1 FL=1